MRIRNCIRNSNPGYNHASWTANSVMKTWFRKKYNPLSALSC
jgi:hypothetical protein